MPRSRRKSPKAKSPGTRKLKLKKIGKSPIKGKKLRAYFTDGTHTDFGASGYQDFTKHRQPERKSRYIKRHRKAENWKSPKSAGALSRWILWNKPSLRASISDYRRRFKM